MLNYKVTMYLHLWYPRPPSLSIYSGSSSTQFPTSQNPHLFCREVLGFFSFWIWFFEVEVEVEVEGGEVELMKLNFIFNWVQKMFENFWYVFSLWLSNFGNYFEHIYGVFTRITTLWSKFILKIRLLIYLLKWTYFVSR